MSFSQLNILGKKRTPFLFICDYELNRVEVIPLDKLQDFDIEFAINQTDGITSQKNPLRSEPISFTDYKQKFDQVIEKIKAGETYILNLTQPTKVNTNLSLQEIYTRACAKYKLRYKDEFVCFSPETFVRIEADKIHTFPMKGTIDASIENAKEKILSDVKEMAEHVMIVDLLRNDLSIVATDVRVESFRYIEKIAAGEKELLQVSSHISGVLEPEWENKLGDILKVLLPAGSITGAPKRSTVNIIKDIEGYNRGYFSGVFGIFDGDSFESAVMIRFLQKSEDGFIYKSGGGITLDSSATLEYQEYKDKVYIP